MTNPLLLELVLLDVAPLPTQVMAPCAENDISSTVRNATHLNSHIGRRRTAGSEKFPRVQFMASLQPWWQI
jgi:hypothetical protein